MDGDTIFALASAPGRAGVAVLRLSGPRAAAAARALTGSSLPPPREARLRGFYDSGGEVFDRGLLLWFPGPGSFTGEDVAECHLHGGPAVLAAAAETLTALGLRPAEAGEFSRRAFAHGRLDLTQAEGLADLVNAETAAQRRQAFGQMEGALGRRLEAWRQQLLTALAHLEALVDFPDEDLPPEVLTQIYHNILCLENDITQYLVDSRQGERLRDGVDIALLGPPNAGKSSLLNAIARRPAAITAATAGTTRDIVELRLDLDGLPVILADTAGLRGPGLDAFSDPPTAPDPVEVEGMRRALARAAAADLRLLVVEATADLATILPPLLARLSRPPAPGAEGPDLLLVVNKTDLMASPSLRSLDFVEGTPPVFPVSAVTGEGVPALLAALGRAAAARLPAAGAVVLTRARHRAALGACAEALSRAASRLGASSQIQNLGAEAELVAEDLRLAARALGRLTGKVDVEELLDLVFRDFCIGK